MNLVLRISVLFVVYSFDYPPLFICYFYYVLQFPSCPPREFGRTKERFRNCIFFLFAPNVRVSSRRGARRDRSGVDVDAHGAMAAGSHGWTTKVSQFCYLRLRRARRSPVGSKNDDADRSMSKTAVLRETQISTQNATSRALLHSLESQRHSRDGIKKESSIREDISQIIYSDPGNRQLRTSTLDRLSIWER